MSYGEARPAGAPRRVSGHAGSAPHDVLALNLALDGAAPAAQGIPSR
jgi:hypothetical protein